MKTRESRINRAIAALQLASECGGELDQAEYKWACQDLESVRDELLAKNQLRDGNVLPSTGEAYNAEDQPPQAAFD